MATNFDRDGRISASERVSSGADSIRVGARRSRDSEARWEEVKQKIARALVADPDLFFYWVFLSSNCARSLGIKLSGLISQMIQGADGQRFPQASVPDSATHSLESCITLANTVLDQGFSLSEELVGQLQREGVRFTNEYLVPNFRQGNRVQLKGEDAASSYLKARREVLSKWSVFYIYLRPFLFKNPLPLSLIRREAMLRPLEALQKTAELPFPQDQACLYSLQFLAAVAAVSSMGRPIDSFTRVLSTQDDFFPRKLQIQEHTVEGGLVTKFKIFDPNLGAVVDPRTLGIKKYDEVQWLGFSEIVSFVSSTYVSISSSQVPSGTSPVVHILAGPASAFRTLRDETTLCIKDLPTTVRFGETLERLEKERSASGTRDLVAFLAEIAACLYPLDNETLKVLDRLDVDPPSGASFSQALLDFSPKFAPETKSAGLDALDLLQAEGFDRAERLLLQGNLEDFFLLTAEGTSFVGHFGSAASGLIDSVRPRVTIGFQSRAHG